MMALSEVERAPVEECSGQGRSGSQEDLERAAPFLAAIGANEIEVVPVGGDLGPEVLGAGEGLAVEELVFHEAMDGFDIALPGVALGRDVTVMGAQGADGGRQALFVLVFQELTAVIGLPGEGGERDAVAGEVDGELFGQEGGVGLGEFVGVAGEGGTGDDFAGGVLEAGQFEVGHLRPIVRDVLQILGVGGKLAEELPVAFDGAELFFGGGLLLAGSHQLMVTKDAGDGVVTARQGKLVAEAFGPKAGLAAEFNDLTFEAGARLVGTVLGATAVLLQGGRFPRLGTAQPLAHGVARAAELPCRGLEPVAASIGHQLLMQPMTIGAHAIQLKVGAVHHRRVASFSRRCCASSGGGAAAHPCGEHSTL